MRWPHSSAVGNDLHHLSNIASEENLDGGDSAGPTEISSEDHSPDIHLAWVGRLPTYRVLSVRSATRMSLSSGYTLPGVSHWQPLNAASTAPMMQSMGTVPVSRQSAAVHSSRR